LYDDREGVRVIDKDNAPRWQTACIEEVGERPGL